MIRDVLLMGDPRLLERSRELDRMDTPELASLLEALRDTMRAPYGAGLAAPQIGVGLRVVTFGVERNPRYPELQPGPDTGRGNPVVATMPDAARAGERGRPGGAGLGGPGAGGKGGGVRTLEPCFVLGLGGRTGRELGVRGQPSTPRPGLELAARCHASPLRSAALCRGRDRSRVRCRSRPGPGLARTGSCSASKCRSRSSS